MSVGVYRTCCTVELICDSHNEQSAESEVHQTNKFASVYNGRLSSEIYACSMHVASAVGMLK